MKPTRSLQFVVFCHIMMFVWMPILAEEMPTEKPPVAKTGETKPAALKNVELPGLTVNRQKGYLDVEATVCLEEGMLELIACTPETKEHESILCVKARPMLIHTGLLLLGADSGNPAMMKLVDEKENRWVPIPPRGQAVDVSLVVAEHGKATEYPISRFVKRVEQDPFGEPIETPKSDRDETKETLPSTFLFAGSHIQENNQGKRRYLADVNGNVISISSFGDEVLCLPEVFSHSNDSLVWEVDSKLLPKRGTKVTLRLRPKKVDDKKKTTESEKPNVEAKK